jgi:hypothetical protein
MTAPAVPAATSAAAKPPSVARFTSADTTAASHLEIGVGMTDAGCRPPFPSVRYLTEEMCYAEPPGTTSPLS